MGMIVRFENKNYYPLAAVLLLAFICSFTDCRQMQPNEETLLQYTRASGAYSEGLFSEAAEMLVPLKSFPPALVLRGKALYFLDRNAEAEKSFRKALSIRPSSTEASIYLVRIYKENGRLDEAESIVTSLISDDPSDIRAFRLAAALSFLKGPEGESQGTVYLDKAIEASTEASFAFLDRARRRWVSGDGNGAIRDLRTAKVLVPENSALFRSISTLERTIMEAIN
jgi:tetratricopeptide (TPR) repeat protein